MKIQAPPLIEGVGSPTINTKTNPDGANIIVLNSDNGTVDVNITTGTGALLPMTVGINIVQSGDTLTTTPPYTHAWLLYNKDDPIILPSPLYKVRFIGSDANWTGVGSTGHAIDINITAKPTRRMDW